jgi:menaquinone-dependent protoporphyrinogen oxidase
MKRILVAYWTKTGTTRGAAEEIARVLSSRGLVAEARELGAVGEQGSWDALILGAPINGMAWKPEALAFLKAHAESFRGKPVAYFLVSYLLFEGRPSIRAAIRRALEPAAAIHPPLATGAFGGRLPGPLPAPMRLLFGVRKDAPLDLVDLAAVRDWAAELAAGLGGGD